jgi:hypothetical protein
MKRTGGCAEARQRRKDAAIQSTTRVKDDPSCRCFATDSGKLGRHLREDVVRRRKQNNIRLEDIASYPTPWPSGTNPADSRLRVGV